MPVHCQSADQCRRKCRIPRQAALLLLPKFLRANLRRRECIVARDNGVIVIPRGDEAARHPASGILTRAFPQIAVKRLDTTREIRPVVMRSQETDDEIRQF